jgi:uncharacterized protein (TIGR02246 family)
MVIHALSWWNFRESKILTAMRRRTAVLSALTGLAYSATISRVPAAEEGSAVNPELEKVKALLKAHDDALKGHDLEGVLKTFAKKGAVMGTGPGEIWSGAEELKDAYTHFFEGFDKGEQAFEYQHKFGGLNGDMGWLMASGNVSGKLKGKEVSLPLNISITAAKEDGEWKIFSLHFSTLTGSEAK